MSAAADLLLKTTLWTTWTTARTTKADSVFSTPAARKPATMNGSIPFPYYMWYSTISMYPTLDPLPSPRTRPCMSHPHPTFRLPRPRLHKLLVPIRFFTNTLQSVQAPQQMYTYEQILYKHLMSRTPIYMQSAQQTSPPNLHPSTTGKAKNTTPVLPQRQ